MAVLAPLVQVPAGGIEERVIEFQGINRRSVKEDGEMVDMYNLTADDYPCLTQRGGRAKLKLDSGTPVGSAKKLLVKNDEFGVIDTHGYFHHTNSTYNYEDSQMHTDYRFEANKNMVAINNKICFFPDKVYFNTDTGTFGNLEAELESTSVTVTDILSTDTTELDFGLVSVANKFNVDDAVMIEGTMTYLDSDNVPQTVTYGGDTAISAVVKKVDTDSNIISLPFNTFLELQEAGATTGTFSEITISRSCPDLDFVMEYNNRLWGVSNADNTIYASKLGDPTNWQYFQATSLDSFYAEQGSDGEWTGCAAYTNHLLFFKEECIHKVYGSSPATFQIATTICHSVEKGSGDSVAIINGVVIYNSKTGIMAYDGGTPVLLSGKLNKMKLTDVVAGTDGYKYYCSGLVNGDPEDPKMLVYSMEYGTWHIEDDTRAVQFIYYKGKVVYLDEDGTAWVMDADDIKPGDWVWPEVEEMDEEEKNIRWMAEFGPFHEYVERKKIYSKMRMRLELEQDAEMDIYIKTDKDDWELVQHIRDQYGTDLTVQIVPRRCEQFRLKLEGEGRCRIESLVRQFRVRYEGDLRR